MYATQPSPRYSPPTPTRQRAMPRHHAKIRQSQRVHQLTRETLVKLGVNGVLLGVSSFALVKLLPLHLANQSQLRDVQAELSSTQQRVGHLQDDFNRTFDPTQAKAVMAQQSYRADPNQKRVIFTPIPGPAPSNSLIQSGSSLTSVSY